MQILQGLLGDGGLSAQDPAQLHAEQAEVSAAVDQRVTLIVGREHPVGAGGSWSERSESQGYLAHKDLLILNQLAVNEDSYLLPEKETSSLAGSAGFLTLAAPTMELVLPSSLQAEKKKCCSLKA